MAKMHCSYGPDMSDSDESSYDGFYFGDNHISKKTHQQQYVSPDQNLYNALIEGDLNVMIEEMDALNYHVDQIVRGKTMLMTACQQGHYELVEYLIKKRNANVNFQVDLDMPLILACDCLQKNMYLVEKIVRLLLENRAIVNVSDKYGMTPFMFACRNGFSSVVKLMVQQASFDAMNNQGCTALFLAVEENHADIVKILIDAGANATIPNGKGYTPFQAAEFHGFYDLLEILPKPKQGYVVPVQFLSYNTLRDRIPQIFLKSDCPEYFQELYSILQSLDMLNILEIFAKKRISLAEFLTMNEEKLKDIGIHMPVLRSKIMKGVLDFHLHHWTKRSIARVKRDGTDNFYAILMITANHLQHLIIIQASLRFAIDNQLVGRLGKPSETQMMNFQKNLSTYRDVVIDLKRTVKYLSSFSPSKHWEFIDNHDVIVKRNKVRKYFKYTTIILGISVFICLKCKCWF